MADENIPEDLIKKYDVRDQYGSKEESDRRKDLIPDDPRQPVGNKYDAAVRANRRVPNAVLYPTDLDKRVIENLKANIEGFVEYPKGEKPTNPKDIVGSDKLPLHLWPATATAMGCLGMLEGALKYGRNNFRVLGVKSSIYVSACKRHLDAWFEGEDFTPEGLPHLANALACLAIIVDAQAAGTLIDDRQYPGGYAELKEQLTPLVANLRKEFADKDPVHYVRTEVATIDVMADNDPHHYIHVRNEPCYKCGGLGAHPGACLWCGKSR